MNSNKNIKSRMFLCGNPVQKPMAPCHIFLSSCDSSAYSGGMTFSQDIPAILLLGGAGTRIAALYPDLPKALVPVAGRPFLEHQLLWLARNDIRRVHLAAGIKADRLEAWLAAPRPLDLRGLDITLSREPSPLGTGGALRHLLPILPDAPAFLSFNGDTLTPNLALDLSALLPSSFFLRTSPSCAHLWASPVDDATRYGTLDLSPDGRVLAFREKSAVRGPAHVNAGIYLLPRSLLETIPAGRPVSLETECLPRWASSGLLLSHPVPPPLLDMGTPDGLAEMTRFLSHQSEI